MHCILKHVANSLFSFHSVEGKGRDGNDELAEGHDSDSDGKSNVSVEV